MNSCSIRRVDFERAYVAMSITLGATREEALATLEGKAPEALCEILATGSKTTRAKALADVLATIARDVDSLDVLDVFSREGSS